MRHFFLFTFATILFFLPLQPNIISGNFFHGGAGNDWTIGLGVVLVIFYGYLLFFNKNPVSKTTLQISIFLSLIFLSVIISRTSVSINLPSILHWFVVIWLIPFTHFLCQSYSRKILLGLLLGILTLHAQWAMVQFVVQHDLGLSILGESQLYPTLPAVAKFSTADTKLIRAYGPYPHSNSLAGSLAIGLASFLLSYSTSPLPRRDRPEGPDEVNSNLAISALLLTIFLGLLISFSRSAYLSIAVALSIFLVQQKWSINHKNLFVPLLLIIVIFTPLLQARFTDQEDQALVERSQGLEWYGGIVASLPAWRGLGPGNYQTVLQQYLTQHRIPHEPWHIAPVHNAILLFLAEWGILAALAAAAILFWTTRHSVSYRTKWFILPLLPLILTDHYLATQTAPLAITALAFAVLE